MYMGQPFYTTSARRNAAHIKFTASSADGQLIFRAAADMISNKEKLP